MSKETVLDITSRLHAIRREFGLGYGGEIAIFSLLREVIQAIKPQRITNNKVDKRSIRGNAAEHFNWAIDDMEARAKRIGL